MIIDFYNRGGGGTPSSGGTGGVTKAQVQSMISSALTEYSEDIEAGEPIVGLAKNLYSPDGVTNQDTFIMRTTAGEDSVSTGVAYLKQVKGRTIATEPVYAGVYGTFVPTDRFTVVFTGDTSTESSTTYTYSNGEWDGDVSDFVITGLLLDGDEFTLTIGEQDYYNLMAAQFDEGTVTYDGSLDDEVGDSYTFYYGSDDEWHLNGIGGDIVNLSDYGINATGATPSPQTMNTIGLWASARTIASVSYNRVTRVNPTISINSETYEAEAGETGTTVFSYDGSDWTPGLTAYGITVTGDIYDGDGISVLYTGSIYTPMQDTTPTSFTALGLNSFDKDNPTTKVIDGVTYYIVKAVGGLADGYVIYGGSGATITGGVAATDNESAITTTTGATTLVVNPTTGATYIYFTTTGSIDDVCVHPQWSGYMNEAYEPYSESTVVLPTKDTNGHTLPALISVGNVGNIMDLENGIFTQYVESIPATEELIQQYRTGKTWGVDYVFDSNHIYQVLDTPVEIEMEETINAYNENDFSVEYYNGTSVAVPTVCYYMTNLVDKLRRDVLTKSNVVECTQAEYNTMDHDPDTAYIITDAETVDMDSIVTHVDSLPSAATLGQVVEWNGNLFEWTDQTGSWGKWIETTSSSKKYKNLYYDYIPSSMDGQLICSIDPYNGRRYLFLDLANNQIKVYNSNNPSTGTLTKTLTKNGNGEDISASSLFHCWCRWVDNYIYFYANYADNRNLSILYEQGDLCSTSITGSHWQRVGGEEFAHNTHTSARFGIPFWNEEGAITDVYWVGNYDTGIYLNADDVYSSSRRTAQFFGSGKFNFFAPTAGGTAGQVLRAGGSNTAPTWVDFYTNYTAGVHFWKGSQDAYDALGTYDANTLYIIIPD